MIMHFHTVVSSLGPLFIANMFSESETLSQVERLLEHCEAELCGEGERDMLTYVFIVVLSASLTPSFMTKLISYLCDPILWY
jgi:hypothetical protein